MLREDLAVLRHEAEAGARDVVRLQPGHHPAFQGDPAAPGRRQAHDRLHGGRLAGTVAAEQRHGLALPHRKADTEQDLAGAVIDVEILDLHDRLRTHIAAPA